MQIVFFTHPQFLGSQSMPRFANWLATGMKERGHSVEMWTPQPSFYKLPAPKKFKRFLGYIDQYIVFKWKSKWKLKNIPKDALFVFTDHALGPWVPIASKRNHVVHCHDFLAQRSALGKISENPTSWSGQQYQAYIRRGYQQGRNFISTSEQTRKDLHDFLITEPDRSVVVYNGLNRAFFPVEDPIASRNKLAERTGLNVASGYILHVGGNQWYKNRVGIVEIYTAWRRSNPESSLPLLLMGEPADTSLTAAINKSPFKSDILVKTKATDEEVGLGYGGATIFLFPSLAEGFGWPIAEAMATGVPVITTDEMPMSEVAGDAGLLIPRKPEDPARVDEWAKAAASKLNELVSLSEEDRKIVIEKGIKNASRFDSAKILDQIEQVYKDIIAKN